MTQKGGKHTDEARAKMRASHLGVPCGLHEPETVEKIRRANMGKRHTAATRAKMSISARVRAPQTHEKCARIAESMRRVWAERLAERNRRE